MDNIIVVVKIIAGCVLGRGRLLLVAAISRRELMRRVTVYRRLPRIFVPAIRHRCALSRPHDLQFTSYALEMAAVLSRFLKAPYTPNEITAGLSRHGRLHSASGTPPTIFPRGTLDNFDV